MNAIRYLSKAHVEFDFFAGRSASARCAPVCFRAYGCPPCPTCGAPEPAARRSYVIDRLTSAKTAAINPKCAVTVDVHNRRTDPVIKVAYSELPPRFPQAWLRLITPRVCDSQRMARRKSSTSR